MSNVEMRQRNFWMVISIISILVASYFLYYSRNTYKKHVNVSKKIEFLTYEIQKVRIEKQKLKFQIEALRINSDYQNLLSDMGYVENNEILVEITPPKIIKNNQTLPIWLYTIFIGFFLIFVLLFFDLYFKKGYIQNYIQLLRLYKVKIKERLMALSGIQNKKSKTSKTHLRKQNQGVKALKKESNIGLSSTSKVRGATHLRPSQKLRIYR